MVKFIPRDFAGIDCFAELKEYPLVFVPEEKQLIIPVTSKTRIDDFAKALEQVTTKKDDLVLSLLPTINHKETYDLTYVQLQAMRLIKSIKEKRNLKKDIFTVLDNVHAGFQNRTLDSPSSSIRTITLLTYQLLAKEEQEKVETMGQYLLEDGPTPQTERVEEYFSSVASIVSNSKVLSNLEQECNELFAHLTYKKEEIFTKEEVEKMVDTTMIRFDKGLELTKIEKICNVIENIPQEYRYRTLFQVEDAVLTQTEVRMINKVADIVSKKGWEELRVIDPELRIQEAEFSFDGEYQEAWTTSLIQYANHEIDRVVKEIKDARLSPLEAVARIHRYASAVKTQDVTNMYEQYSMRSSIMGAYLDDSTIICAGRTAIMKACIDRLNMEGLSCETIVMAIFKEEHHKEEDVGSKITYFPEGNHIQLLVHVQDRKYDQKGDFLNDATWDKAIIEGMISFGNCLLPCDALYHYQKGVIQPAIPTNKVYSEGRDLKEEAFDRKNGQDDTRFFPSNSSKTEKCIATKSNGKGHLYHDTKDQSDPTTKRFDRIYVRDCGYKSYRKYRPLERSRSIPI